VATIWSESRGYLQLVEVEQAFKELKNDLSIRPIYHQLEIRIDAHIFIAILAHCLAKQRQINFVVN
jgi:transposase